MADETAETAETAETEGATSKGGGRHGRGGHGKGGGPAWLHGKHRTEILVIGGTAALLLIVLAMKGGKGASSADAQQSQVGYTTGRAQAGAVGNVAGTDAQAVAGLQTMLANQSDLLSRLGANVDSIIGDTAIPTNIASGLFSPNFTGNYVRDAQGSIVEIESDGSLFGFTPQQWQKANELQGSGDAAWKGLTQLGSNFTDWYDTGSNIAKQSVKGVATTTK